MSSLQNRKKSAVLFILAGVAFFVAAVAMGQPAVYALGAVFIALGAVQLRKLRALPGDVT